MACVALTSYMLQRSQLTQFDHLTHYGHMDQVLLVSVVHLWEVKSFVPNRARFSRLNWDRDAAGGRV